MQYFLTLERFLRFLKQNPQYGPPMIAGSAGVLLVLVFVGYWFHKYWYLLLKSLTRNLLRTGLSALAVFVLAIVVTLVWTILVVLDVVMTEKAKDFKAIVTERWQVPSRMPIAYAPSLKEGAASKPGDLKPDDNMSWQFYGGTLDPEKRTWENTLFFFAMEADKIIPMMDDLENLNPVYVKRLMENKQGAILGRERLKRLNKGIGDRFTVVSMSHKGIDLEFEIVGEFPAGRYDSSAVMNGNYLVDAMDAYPTTHNGAKHPMADKSLGLVWFKVPDSDAFSKVAEQIMSSSLYTSPAVKVETASSGIASFLEPYKDLLWGLKWLLVPALLVTMALIVANAISISVRERRTEMAVLKVIGFTPGRILGLVLGEAFLVGGASGLLSAAVLYGAIHVGMGGFPFQIAFFTKFDIYVDSLWWGFRFGTITSLAGSIVPAWSARTIKVSEVFAKVA